MSAVHVRVLIVLEYAVILEHIGMTYDPVLLEDTAHAGRGGTLRNNYLDLGFVI